MRWDWKVLVGIVLAAVAAGWFLTRSVHESEADLADIDRDLAELSGALRADLVTEGDLIPRASAGIHLPNVLVYRRSAEFWAPAIRRSRGAE